MHLHTHVEWMGGEDQTGEAPVCPLWSQHLFWSHPQGGKGEQGLPGPSGPKGEKGARVSLQPCLLQGPSQLCFGGGLG